MKRRFVALALTAPFLLGACGTAASQDAVAVSSKPAQAQTQDIKSVAEITAGSTFNDTDVMFLQMLADNEEQGLEMVALAAERAKRQEIVDFAKAVELTQTDELTMIKNWLTEWDKPIELDERESLHADHGGLPVTTEKEIAGLRKIKKADFETAFINLFLGHQQSAIEFATLELDKGGNEQAKALAERVKQSRADQVQQMLKLLNS
ncbi:DUF305 domain-containing protein [Actinoplanes sp. OR16]|uniref:DUF305 domain-containing protein n=1 Tax=Actinoplanes sp. OR16 TaxID=946334 RepID=UPI000F6F694B|nr:DUF305 domain-containing protein [Actinoplanes sp. OR16]BBH65222.1 DUF305 domain-containing protein [Actinoplanes sp. OR16]